MYKRFNLGNIFRQCLLNNTAIKILILLANTLNLEYKEMYNVY